MVVADDTDGVVLPGVYAVGEACGTYAIARFFPSICRVLNLHFDVSTNMIRFEKERETFTS